MRKTRNFCWSGLPASLREILQMGATAQEFNDTTKYGLYGSCSLKHDTKRSDETIRHVSGLFPARVGREVVGRATSCAANWT